VTNIPTHMTLEDIENYFNQTIGPVVKLEIEDNQPCKLYIIVYILHKYNMIHLQ
jgi:hypothetical protein